KHYNWFHHVKQWVENKNNLNIHFVKYEDLRQDFDTTVKGIANFLEIDLTGEILARVQQRTSFEYMHSQQHKLGPRIDLVKDIVHKPYSVVNQDKFIRSGSVGEGIVALSPE